MCRPAISGNPAHQAPVLVPIKAKVREVRDRQHAVQAELAAELFAAKKALQSAALLAVKIQSRLSALTDCSRSLAGQKCAHAC